VFDAHLHSVAVSVAGQRAHGTAARQATEYTVEYISEPLTDTDSSLAEMGKQQESPALK